ncbi:fungal-specific transcription factor domain-containing protein [Xylariales sp. PMI_506]|nr:fungal-specific transcription factor domain-containing protein [Xylariales sp. PMI_506]
MSVASTSGSTPQPERATPSGTPNSVSCERCRRRKIKCDKHEPCARCIKAGEDCFFPGGGARQKPASKHLVRALQTQVSTLESFIQQLASGDDVARRKLLSNHLSSSCSSSSAPSLPPPLPQPHHPAPETRLDPAGPIVQDTPKATSSPVNSVSPSNASTSGDVVLARAREGRMRKLTARKASQFFGGTSLFQVQLSEKVPTPQAMQHTLTAAPSTQGAIGDYASPSDNFQYHPHDAVCSQLMAIFFQNLYQYNHCIYREYFLRDYDARGGPYYSDVLMYSICAAAALVAEERSLRALYPIFMHHAERLLLNSLDLPDLTTLQSLVVLGHLEIGQGRGSKGWLFCGMACRLTHEMGLHLDPSNWNSKGESTLEREILRRVYWAVFIADKQLSLYFGRPPALYPQEADVRNTIRIPYPPEWQALLDNYISSGVSATAFEDGIAVVGSFVHQVELAKIFHTMIVDVFENRRRPDNNSAAEAAQRIHLSLERWLSALPQKLHWNQWTVGKVPHYVLHLHMLFHTGMIILHRPPRQHLDDESVMHGEDVDICYESLAAILRLTKSYGRYYRYQYLPLDFVHTLSASAGVVMMKRYAEKSSWTETAISRPLELILEAMEAIQDVWPCVLEIKEGILEAMKPQEQPETVQQEYELNFDLMDMLESGAGALPNPWSIATDAPSADLGFLVTDDFLNNSHNWDNA